MLTSVGLQIEIVLIHSGRTTIDHSAGLRVPILCRVCRIHWEEASMVPLAANDNSQLGVISCAEPSEGLSDLRHLLLDHDRKLTLRISQYNTAL